MKGQFFLIGIILTSVIMLLSINFLSTNEKIFLIDDEDSYFTNLNYAYEYSVPDDWENVDEDYRVTLGVCVSSDILSEAIYRNSTVELYPDSSEVCSLHEESGFALGNSDCVILVRGNLISSKLDGDTNCNEFVLYYNLTSGSTESYSSNDGEINASKILMESIKNSPLNASSNLSEFYFNRNIKLSASVNSNKTYNLTYDSESLDFEGTI